MTILQGRKTFRSSVNGALPTHLSNRGPKLSSGWKRMWVIASQIDLILEACFQGLYARMPGLGTETALPFIGRDRMLRRGPTETTEGYALRLTKWLDYWRTAGNALATLLALRYYLPTPVLVRMYLRSGFCWTLELDGSLSWVRDTAWDWDSISNPERATGHQTDVWIIINPPNYGVCGPWGAADGDVWGGPSTTGPGVGCFGLDIPADTLNVLRDILIQIKGAHCYVRCVVFSDDVNKFDPENDLSQPDGYWGRWGRDDGSGNLIAARDTDCRYWEPRP